MITEAQYRGGNKKVTHPAAVTLGRTESFIITYTAPGSGFGSRTLTLYNPAPLKPHQVGVRHLIINESGLSVGVRNSASSLIGSIASGDCAYLILVDPATNSWRMSSTFDLNSVGTFSRGSRAGIENPESPPRYQDLYCTDGDICDVIDALPLDGTGGRAEVVVPMIEDPSHCQNSAREPIRAADIIMPSIIPLRMLRSGFEVDTNHPLGSSSLSAEFYDALFGVSDDKTPWHELEYVDENTGTSRNPYHVRYSGSPLSIGFPALSPTRHYWSKTIEYTIEATGSTEYIYLRFYLEHTIPTGQQPSASGSGGGVQDYEKGMWGTLFCVAVFSTELTSASSYTPTGAAGSVSFSYDDPFVFGSVEGDGIDDKFAHPQCVAFAALPTSWHHPLRYAHIPIENRKYLTAPGGNPQATGTLHGHNREFQYLQYNPAPWGDPDLTQYPGTPAGEGTFGIIVFGYTTGGNNGRALTRNVGRDGGIPKSAPMEWLCWENGRGEGRTYFKPLKPGWDEDEGQLDIAGGNSGSIRLCGVSSGNVDGWPDDTDILPCVGNRDEPFELVGGTHLCFHNNGESTQTLACVPIEPHTFAVTDRCTKQTVTYSDQTILSSCVGVDVTCTLTGSFTTVRSVLVEDYSFNMNGNQNNRTLEWERHLPNPDADECSYAYDPTDVSDLVQEVGAWDLSSDPEVTSLDTGETIDGMLLHWASCSDVVDTTVTFKWTTVDVGNRVGVASRMFISGGANGFTGTAELLSGTTFEIVISIWETGTETVLGDPVEVDLSNYVSNGGIEIELQTWGCELILRVTDGVNSYEITRFTEANEGGGLGHGIAVIGTTIGDTFEDWSILDESARLLVIEATLGQDTFSSSFPSDLRNSKGQCEQVYNPDCGTVPKCSCKTWSEFLTLGDTPNISGEISLTDGVTDGTNPTVCGGGSPHICKSISDVCGGMVEVLSCDECLGWWASGRFCLKSCYPEGAETPSLFSTGFSQWKWLSVFCP